MCNTKPNTSFLSCLIAFVALIALPLSAAAYPPEIEGATVEVYKTIGDVELNAWIFNPPKHKSSASAPAILFYFGGGWRGGSPTQFENQAKFLAARGMVAILIDYRVLSRHGVPARDCVKDAKSAIRWVRQNAARLGVDPDRIVASGGSAGGHLAASTSTLPKYDEKSEDLSVSSVPNAAALFNPATVLAPHPSLPEFPEEKLEELKQRMGVEPKTLSPYHNVKKGVPPTIIFHGTNDTTVPYETANFFYEKMKEMGNKCELVAYKGAGHGFFNHGRSNNVYYADTLMRLDAFLVSLGYLDPMPEVKHLK
jgi:acetyl esterase/lipase